MPRWLKIAGAAIGVAVLILLVSWLMWNAIASGKMNSRLDAIRASGDPVTMADLARTYPEPPEGENAAERS